METLEEAQVEINEEFLSFMFHNKPFLVSFQKEIQGFQNIQVEVDASTSDGSF